MRVPELPVKVYPSPLPNTTLWPLSFFVNFYFSPQLSNNVASATNNTTYPLRPMAIKFLSSLLGVFILLHHSLAADSPIVGEWKVRGADVSVILKSDGSGTLNQHEPPPKTHPFKWEKTAQGATLRFDAPTDIGASATVRRGTNEHELIFKAPDHEIILERADVKRKELERLFRAKNLDKLIAQSDWMMISSAKTSRTNVTEATWKKLEEKYSLQKAREEILATYDMFYTIEELKAINAFYESPAGKKELAAAPELWQHVNRILMQRADKIGRDAEAESKPAEKK